MYVLILQPRFRFAKMTDLVTECKDTIHLPAIFAAAECIWFQHDILEVAHHGFYEGGQSLTLQGLQKGLVEILSGVAMTRVEAVVAKCLIEKRQDLGLW